MPIRPELRKFYGRQWREVTRPRILERADNRCENCGVPNHKLVQRAAGWWCQQEQACLYCSTRGSGWLRSTGPVCTCHGFWVTPSGKVTEVPATNFQPAIRRWVGIVLTVAHLNHTSGDDRDANLKALCQWCHLNWDRLHHLESRTARKDAARPLLVLAQEVS
jgi:hypothetical protein